MDYPFDFLDQVIQGDCVDTLKSIPSKTIDLIVTSPPYNLRQSTGNGMNYDAGGLWGNQKLINGYDTISDNMPYDEYISWQRECLSEMFRIIKDTGAIFYNHKWRVQAGLLQDRQEIVEGFPVRQIIIWDRLGGVNFNKGYYLPTYEVIYLIAKKDFEIKKGFQKFGDIWRFAPEHNSNHPAPFPIDLPFRCIESTYSDIILDPFCGSGTTLLAAKRLYRRYIGVDISEKYCDIARKRLKESEQKFLA